MTATRSRSAGFTMIEMTFTLGLIAAVGMMAVTSLADRLPEHDLDHAVSQLRSDLRLARAEAVSRNAEVQVTFNAENESYCIWTDANRNGNADAGETVVRTFPTHVSVNLSTYPATGTFSPQGTFESEYNNVCQITVCELSKKLGK